MQVHLTQLSADEYAHIQSGEMSPSMAAQYLKEGRIVLRTFGDVLRDLYPQPDLQHKLAAAFCGDDYQAALRKVRYWLSGKSVPTSREDIFRIAFALGLSEPQTSQLLGVATEYGIHYRSGRDTVYAWFLRTGRGYQEARDFFSSLPPTPRPGPLPSGSSMVTSELRDRFLRVHTPEELRRAYLDNLERFGELHSRAYFYFEKYLKQLTRPAASWGEDKEPDYSLETVMDLYLSLKMPVSRSRQGYTPVQKLIKHNWPNATALRNIVLHKADVPRKLLLLLYVITENVVDDSYDEMDEEYISSEERLEDNWWTLNSILTDCGMPLLDPRNATDWLVLYAITAEDEPMSERMEQVIELLYADQKPG